MDGLKRVLTKNPVRISGLVQVIIGCAIAFGLGWTGEQVGAVMAVTAGVLALLAEIFVTPNAKFDAAVVTEAENIVQEQTAPLTAEERATLTQLRAERDDLRAAARRRGREG